MVNELALMEKQEKYIKEFSFISFIKLILVIRKRNNKYLLRINKHFFGLNFRSLYLFYKEYANFTTKKINLSNGNNSSLIALNKSFLVRQRKKEAFKNSTVFVYSKMEAKFRRFNYKKYLYIASAYTKLLGLLFDKLDFIYSYTFISNNIRKEIFINFLKRKNFLNLFYKNFYYIAFIKKKKSNIYITITNRHGDVIIAQSFGKIGLYARKQRKIQEPYKALFAPVFSKARRLEIYVLEYMYFISFTKKIFIEVKKAIRGRFRVKHFRNYIPIPHNNRLNTKLKRIRRI
jgi:hypothetical protein